MTKTTKNTPKKAKTPQNAKKPVSKAKKQVAFVKELKHLPIFERYESTFLGSMKPTDGLGDISTWVISSDTHDSVVVIRKYKDRLMAIQSIIDNKTGKIVEGMENLTFGHPFEWLLHLAIWLESERTSIFGKISRAIDSVSKFLSFK